MKHTPGPWEIEPIRLYPGTIRDCIEIRSDNAGGWWIAHVQTAMNLGQSGEANASLIAAAPELLDALKRLVTYAAPFICIVDDPAELTEARAAIAKAEGRQ
jgi:hypothetical protein